MPTARPPGAPKTGAKKPRDPPEISSFKKNKKEGCIEHRKRQIDPLSMSECPNGALRLLFFKAKAGDAGLSGFRENENFFERVLDGLKTVCLVYRLSQMLGDEINSFFEIYFVRLIGAPISQEIKVSVVQNPRIQKDSTKETSGFTGSIYRRV